MKMRLKLISVAQARVGMQISKDVLNAQGQCLLPKGAVLTESNIASLGRRNIQYFHVFIEDGRSEKELVVERAKAVERLNSIFGNADKSSLFESLYLAVLSYRLERLT